MQIKLQCRRPAPSSSSSSAVLRKGFRVDEEGGRRRPPHRHEAVDGDETLALDAILEDVGAEDGVDADELLDAADEQEGIAVGNHGGVGQVGRQGEAGVG